MLRVHVNNFNLPNISWMNSAADPGTHDAKISDQLIEITQDHGLIQIVDEPTRTTQQTESILDLFFTNHHDMVNRHSVIPGLSDHDIPILDISTRIILNKKKPRRIYQYKKGNMQGLVFDREDFAEAYCTKYSGNNGKNFNNMWTELNTGIVTSMDKHIPSKMLSSSKHTAPWITTLIKRQIRKRDIIWESKNIQWKQRLGKIQEPKEERTIRHKEIILVSRGR